MHGPGERLLHVHMLAQVHRRFGDHRVVVIGRRDDDRVDVFLLGEHLAEVVILWSFVELLLQLDCGGADLSVAIGPLLGRDVRLGKGHVYVAHRHELFRL